MSKELKEALKELNIDGKLNEFTVAKNIDWKFHLPSASHMVDAWECLIRSIKTEIVIFFKEQAPKEETLITLLTEIEHCVNSRPLTHVSIDPRDLEALIPNHF